MRQLHIESHFFLQHTSMLGDGVLKREKKKRKKSKHPDLQNEKDHLGALLSIFTATILRVDPML